MNFNSSNSSAINELARKFMALSRRSVAADIKRRGDKAKAAKPRKKLR